MHPEPAGQLVFLWKLIGAAYPASRLSRPIFCLTLHCCFNFQIRKIPLNAIIKYENVDRDCPISGVIFTVRTSRVCADPNQSWVQQAMNKIDQRLLKSTEPKPRRHQKPRVLIQLNPPGSATFKT
uniref:C-C motif chemokine n=1 Tax=Astyanax mexicanus TaxID=7994 RepID=A0A3B1JWA4_ASTMX